MFKPVDFILIGQSAEGTQHSLRLIKDNETVNKIIFTLGNGIFQEEGAGECFKLDTYGGGSTDFLECIFKSTSSRYIALYKSSAIFEPGYRCLERMVGIAEETDAKMVYADHYDSIDGNISIHPLTDYQEGSVRDDFDFGGLWLIRRDSLACFIKEETAVRYSYAGLYAFRLYISRIGEILHIKEYLYTERRDTSLRKSGEMQFDYVNPANKDVQFENECVFTNYLKEIGAWLPPVEIENVPDDNETWPVEASVIIPVRNRVKTIADAVHSVLSQQACFAFNVIVVDNHSTDGTDCEVERIASLDKRVILLKPLRNDLGIGGCWDLAIRSIHCGRYAIQLDSDDLYSGNNTLEKIIRKFREEKSAMVVGSYRIVDFKLKTLPPGLISHNEWTASNGRNNALRINGLGAPRAFRTSILRNIGFPNTSYGEDYAVGLAVSRHYRISRIYDELYLCRRWDGNSDSNLSIEKQNKNNSYKDSIRTAEIKARRKLVQEWNSPISETKVNRFFKEQLASWHELEEVFNSLENEVKTKALRGSDGCSIAVQWNPKRIVSTGAKIDKATLNERPCFLCDNNRPKEQLSMKVEGSFQVLVNPFPILAGHLTLPSRHHVPQRFAGLFHLMCRAINELHSYVIFYNGPHCGASAPDHAHLQAGKKGKLPIERDWSKYEPKLEYLYSLTPHNDSEQMPTMISRVKGYVCPAFAVTYKEEREATHLAGLLLRYFPNGSENIGEPDFNVVGWKVLGNEHSGKEEYKVMIFFPRRKHRPDCYYAEGKGQTMVSPGSIDMGGLIITPREEDYNKMTYDIASNILKEVAISEAQSNHISMLIKGADGNGQFDFDSEECNNEIRKIDSYSPFVTVGIMHEKEIDFTLNGKYHFEGREIAGNLRVTATNKGIFFCGKVYNELIFTPDDLHSTFILKDVTIGINFHWQRKEDQTFSGALKIIHNGNELIAINVVPVEEYLKSVISSEMKATAPLELLKSHAVISRSWLLCQIRKRKGNVRQKLEDQSGNKPVGNFLKWYDRDDHRLFDVCSDDHCQRYQGITREISKNAILAVNQTRGLVLSNKGEVCDARFSKCCGGITEAYSTCWEDKDVPFLMPVYDNEDNKSANGFNDEKDVEDFIEDTDYDAFCNTDDKQLLAQVLNDYDTETRDFFRWKLTYSQEEIQDIIKEKTGKNLGQIVDILPQKRGKSGRIWLLEIIGTKQSIKVGKELEIRRILSRTHLYSSAFIVRKGKTDCNGVPQNIELLGAGWGHGVGLCQIGAAVMGKKGYSYRQILRHYYKNADIDKLY